MGERLNLCSAFQAELSSLPTQPHSSYSTSRTVLDEAGMSTEPAAPRLPGQAGDSVQPSGKRSRTCWHLPPFNHHLQFARNIHSFSILAPYHLFSQPFTMHEHLGLNLGTSGPRHSSTSGIPSPPQTQQQQHQPSQAGPSRAPPAPPPAPVPRLQPPPVATDAPPREPTLVGHGGLPPAVGNVAAPIANGRAANGRAHPPAPAAQQHLDPTLKLLRIKPPS